VTTAALFLIKRDAPRINNQDTTDRLSYLVFTLFIILEVSTILYFVWRRSIYPKLVYNNYIDPMRKWRVIPLSKWGHFACKKTTHFSSFVRVKQDLFSYSGQVNDKGEPDGFGVWSSDRFSGEILSGYWQGGKPIGPFKSREFGTGYSFANVRIGFMTCSAAAWDKGPWNMAFAPEYVFGVTGVECSVSGYVFFSFPWVMSLTSLAENSFSSFQTPR
jgi:hypothetical protein